MTEHDNNTDTKANKQWDDFMYNCRAFYIESCKFARGAIAAIAVMEIVKAIASGDIGLAGQNLVGAILVEGILTWDIIHRSREQKAETARRSKQASEIPDVGV